MSIKIRLDFLIFNFSLKYSILSGFLIIGFATPSFYAEVHWRLFYSEMDKATNGISAIF